MFLIIDTNGANKIAINIPLSGADKSLPAIAAMFEKNAVFISSSYHDQKTVTPKMEIKLGNIFECTNSNEDIIAIPSDVEHVISDDFQIVSNDVYVSNAKKIKSLNDQISKYSTENTFLKNEIERLKDAVNSANSVDGE